MSRSQFASVLGKTSSAAGLRTLVAVGAMLAAAAGCNRAGAKQADAKPPEVHVSTPVKAEVIDYEEFTGQIEAKKSVKIQARVTGYLKSFNFKEGDAVLKDQILFEIDPEPYQAKLGQAKAAVVQAKAKLTTTELNYKRAKELWERKDKAIGKEEYDVAEGAYAEAKANVNALDEMVHSAQLDVNYSTVRAPLAGKISRIYVDEGNLIKADTTVLTSLVSEHPIYVYFNLDERTLLKMQRLVFTGEFKTIRETAETVLVGLGDEEKENYPFEGKMDFLDNKLDPSTGTLLVRGVFDNSKGMLYPGLFARIKLPIGKKHQSVLVSERAFGTNQGQKFVYIVKEVNGKPTAISQDVKLGALQNGLRVVEQGLKGDELIMVSGVQKVRDKTVVQPKVVTMPAMITAPPSVTISPNLDPAPKNDKSH